MAPLAHHAGEQTLTAYLLLSGGTLSLAMSIGLARLAAARASLARRLRRSRQNGRGG